MNILKTPNQEELYRLLFQLPPQFEEAKCFIHREKLTAEDVTRVGVQYAENCFLDYGESLSKTAWENTSRGNCEKNIPYKAHISTRLRSSSCGTE